MKKTIFVKTFWSGILILVTAVVLITAFTFSGLKRWHRTDLQEHLVQLGHSLQPGVISRMEASPDKLDLWTKTMGARIRARISVIAPDGSVLADSSALPERMDNHGNRPEISQAMEGVNASRIRFSNTLMADMLYVALPLQENSQLKGVLRISMNMSAIRGLRLELETRILIVLITFLLLSILITYFNSRRISRPIQHLARAARTVSKGDFTPRVHVSDGGELGDLTLSFNRMVEHQSRMFTELSSSREQLETLFSSMREALVVIEVDGTIRIGNNSFENLVESRNISGKKYWEVLRSNDFYTMIRDLMGNPRAFSGEIEFSNRNFLVNFTLIPTGEAFVVTFLDVTERRKLETIKKDFVGNVSHELKTPLTSIKGFLEILESEEKDPEKLQYMDIIKRNADRMIHIIKDLLLLSRMEAGSFRIQLESVELTALIHNTAKLFDTALKEKALELTLSIQDDLPVIRGDGARLEDMLVNLLDNAIKYTESGGIRISAEEEDDGIALRVTDSGIGIPKELQERIFERFFVVDASRSKETGGTGLGLSIVKHIVLLHEGEISLDSAPGDGTTFTIRLPITGNDIV